MTLRPCTRALDAAIWSSRRRILVHFDGLVSSLEEEPPFSQEAIQGAVSAEKLCVLQEFRMTIRGRITDYRFPLPRMPWDSSP